jgi:hypothetical protein
MTSEQVRQELLCDECEDRFAQSENVVARLTELEIGRPKFLQHITRVVLRTGQIAKIDDTIVEPLAYFSASVLWRSSVMKQGCELGPYEEPIRQYLLRADPFPLSVALMVGILEASDEGANPYAWVSSPSTALGVQWVHGFLVCGLVFRCFVDEMLKPDLKRLCIGASNQGRYATIAPATAYLDFMNAVEMAAAAAPRGKLVALTKAGIATGGRNNET